MSYEEVISAEVMLLEAERQIEMLTRLCTRLALDLSLARLELDKLLQKEQVCATNLFNGPN